MAIASARLKPIAFVPIANTVMVQNVAATKTLVQGIFLHNSHTAAVTITLWNVPESGGALGTPGNVNRMYNFAIDPDDTVALDLGKPGWVFEDEYDAVFAVADTASAVTIEISGFLET